MPPWSQSIVYFEVKISTLSIKASYSFKIIVTTNIFKVLVRAIVKGLKINIAKAKSDLDLAEPFVCVKEYQTVQLFICCSSLFNEIQSIFHRAVHYTKWISEVFSEEI